MFSLVKFHNDEFYITRSTRIKIVQGKDCYVKYKGGAKYAAMLVICDDSAEKLKDLLEQIENGTCEQTVPNINYEFKTPTKVRVKKQSIDCDTLVEGGFGFSTPIDTFPSDRTGDNNNDTISCEYSGSSLPPSGLTEILESMGDDWPKNSTGDNTSKDVDELPTDSISYPSYHAERDNFVSNSVNCNNKPDVTYDDREHEDDVTDRNDSSENQNADPNYQPDSSVATTDANRDESAAIPSSSHSPEESSCGATVDVRAIDIPKSKKNGNTQTKKDFCIYCKKLVTQFARHLQKNMHRNEPAVQEFLRYPANTTARNRLIARIRRKGNLEHNKNPMYNTGILITCRRQQNNSRNTVKDYIHCNSCCGLFSKRSIRIHYKNCNVEHQKNVREITVNGRRMVWQGHEKASSVLRNTICSMNNDDIVDHIRYDELIIVAGNKFCDGHTEDQHIDLIRSNLRYLGRLKKEVMARNKKIRQLSDIFNPEYYDIVIESVREIAGYDPKTRLYRAPTNATIVGTLLKKCSSWWSAELIKKKNMEDAEKNLEKFMTLYKADYPTSINKKILEAQIKRKRQKVEIMPLKSDIKKLYTHLHGICRETLLKLSKHGFDFDNWKRLAEASLIRLQMFNRRRAGEIERLLIEDYDRREAIDLDSHPELSANLTAESRALAEKYVRISIRGKLNRTVPVLVDGNLVICLNTILKHRANAGLKDNKYVFGVPTSSKTAKKYLRACTLMRKFAVECNATIPETLRGTKLRKHIATYTAMLGIQENQVDDLANFMGHDKTIHKAFYRLPLPFRDITDVSKLLRAAMGADEDDDDNFLDSDDDSGVGKIQTNTISKNKSSTTNVDTNNFEEDSESENLEPRPSKRRKVSTPGKIKRDPWTIHEKNAILKCFGDIKRLDKLPSLKLCANAISKYPVLSRRNAKSIKTWIHTQRKLSSRR